MCAYVHMYTPLHHVSVHSIMGEGQKLGIVPRFMRELFERIEGTSDSKVCVLLASHTDPITWSNRILTMFKSATLKFTMRRCMTC